jgi:hypothetical protein
MGVDSPIDQLSFATLRESAMRFLDVKTDFAFKKAFGSQQSKPGLIDFSLYVISNCGLAAETPA